MEILPKKRQRREGYYRYGDENERHKVTSSNSSMIVRNKSTPTRVFPSIPGFGPLTRSEVKQDSIEIEKHNSLSSDNTDSEDDDEPIRNNRNIFRSIRPPCPPESTIFRKKIRYFNWVKNEDAMNSDLEKYRKCVEHLSNELKLLKNDELRFEDNVNRTRNELSNLQMYLIDNIHTLQNENDLLYSLIFNELKTQTNQPIADNININSANSKKKLIEMSLNQLEEYDQHILSHIQQISSNNNEIEIDNDNHNEDNNNNNNDNNDNNSETTRNNKRKNIETDSLNSDKVYYYNHSLTQEQSENANNQINTDTNTNSNSNTNLDDQNGNDTNNNNVNNNGNSEEDLNTNISISFGSMVDLLDNWKRSNHIPEENIELRYNKVIQDLNSSNSQIISNLTTSTKSISPTTSSKHSNCLESEKEALLFELFTYPENEIKLHLRQYLNSENHNNHNNNHSNNDQNDDNQNSNDQNIALGRGTRRRKTTTTAAAATTTTSSITTRLQQNISQLQLTALRRTPQNQPLFLTPVSSFEDCFGGILTQIQNDNNNNNNNSDLTSLTSVENIASVENLLYQEINSIKPQIPNDIRLRESQVIRLNNLQACLQRGIRTLYALEKEKIEWTSQIEKILQNSNRDIIEIGLPGINFNYQSNTAITSSTTTTTTTTNNINNNSTNSNTNNSNMTQSTEKVENKGKSTNNHVENHSNHHQQQHNNNNQKDNNSTNVSSISSHSNNNNNNSMTTTTSSNNINNRKGKGRGSEGGNNQQQQNDQGSIIQTTDETIISTVSPNNVVPNSTNLNESHDESSNNHNNNTKDSKDNSKDNKKSKKPTNSKKRR